MITPKNIGKGANLQKYYVTYAQEKGESPGVWSGQASKELGLEGEVKAEDMQKILQGFAPDGRALCKNAGEEHRGGWDLTFSAPKSVSIAWVNADPELRKQIENAHEKSVEIGMKYFQEHSAITRTGDQGVNREKADLVYALFQHSSNRAEEPQLHTHSIVFNVAKTQSDDKWRTLESRDIYKSVMAASAFYKASFSHELQKMGIEVEKTKDSFEIINIPKEVCKAQSSRSQTIEEELKKRGLDRDSASAKSKEAANLSTRAKKENITRDFNRWQKENAEHGFGPNEQKEAFKNLGKDLTKEIKIEDKDKIIENSLENLTMRDSTFTVHKLNREIAENAIGKLNIEEIGNSIKNAFEKTDVFELGEKDSEKHFTTAEMFDLEKKLVESISERIGENKHIISRENINSVLENRKTIKDEQKTALENVTRDGNGVSFLRGFAGAGKSYTMLAVKEAFESENYNVLGVSPTNKAAAELEKSSGIKSTSIDSLLYKIKSNEINLHEKSVIIVDEGAMTDSRKTFLINEYAKNNSVKLIYVGDEKQIQPILGGQAFGTSVKKFGASQLKDIIRQKNKLEGQAILEIRDGKAEKTLEYYSKNNSFHFQNSRLETEKKIIENWGKYTVNNKKESSFIVATTNKTIDRLNVLARDYLKQNNQLENEVLIKSKNGIIPVAENEKIIFTDSNKRNGIYRSEIVTVKSASNNKIVVSKKDGREIEFNPNKFNSFKHAYAITAHKSQGSTVDRSFVLIDSKNMDREKFYVAISRGELNNQVYADKDSVSISDSDYEKLYGIKKENLVHRQNEIYMSELSKLLNKSNMKNTTQDFTLKDENLNFKIKENLKNKLDSITNTFQQLKNNYDKSNNKEILQEKEKVNDKDIHKKQNKFEKQRDIEMDR